KHYNSLEVVYNTLPRHSLNSPQQQQLLLTILSSVLCFSEWESSEWQARKEAGEQDLWSSFMAVWW
ncbi:hypothetical protein LINPERPRIM_LOCUS8620, partial [Linum perenne]